MTSNLANLAPPRLALPLLCLLFQATCAADDFKAEEVSRYTIEQLMNIEVEVVSLGKKSQKLEDTAAAIHVITQEDIRRSGLTSLPELLRLAPGLQTARIDGSTWAVSSRGFNAKNSDNLLVMIDGRIIHTQTFTGVYWDMQDVVLEDIERIEVVRGPGGALWGANAVTGVINIITKTAAATQGGLVSGGAGNFERQGSVRYGGKLGETGNFRVYARDISQDAFPSASGATGYDQRHLRSSGFRADWALPEGNSLTVQGDAFDGYSDHTGTQLSIVPPSSKPINYPIEFQGGNLLTRWKQVRSAAEEWSVQFYYDTYQRRYYNLGERRTTLDLDFQHRLPLGNDHDLLWGLGYRQMDDRFDNTAAVSYNPASRNDNVISAFIQDEMALDGEALHLIVGSKFEHNHYTGFEYQPNLRLRWKLDERQTAWAAVSRAVHTPSRTDEDGRIVVAAIPGNNGVTSLLRLQGNPGLLSETVYAYEAGYRIRPNERVQADVAVFYDEHHDMMTIEPGTPFMEAGRLILPQNFYNKANATTHGLEVSGTWKPADRWSFKAGYSWLKMRIRLDPDSKDTSVMPGAGESPQNQLQFQVFHTPFANLDLSASLYYVDSLPAMSIPSYTRLDLRAAWRPRRDLEVSLTGRNLLDRGHPEFVNSGGPRTTELPRSVFAAATWRF
ncbi:MAG: TonB-dependent receptor [Sulfuricella sp.]|nr:TonB-dependent receptor [Sulfuricella sp.]